MKQPFSVRSLEWSIFRARTKVVNVEAGLLSISLGGAAIGTDAPRLFAFLSMATVLLFMAYRLQSYERVYQLWREVKHPLIQARIVWKFFPIFNVGWLFLALILMGVVHKGGVLSLSF